MDSGFAGWVLWAQPDRLVGPRAGQTICREVERKPSVEPTLASAIPGLFVCASGKASSANRIIRDDGKVCTISARPNAVIADTGGL